MAKPARVNPLAAKYRVSWPAGAPDWQLELGCWANRLNTGFAPYHHLEQAIRLMWPENMWHPWREERFEAFCDPALAHKDGRTITRNFSWMGCGAATKTYDAILLAISWWLADPQDSIVTMTSTTKESSRSRMWAVLRQFWYEFKENTGYDGPHIIDSQMILEVEPGERKHVIYVQAVESGELTKTIANIQGKHAKRMLLIVDEAMGTPDALFTAIPNIFKGATEVNLLFLTNAPLARINPMMKIACPQGGWIAVTPEDKRWPTKAIPEWQIPTGTCLHFSGKDSPNVRAKRTIYPFLYSFENWRKVEGNPEIMKTPQFWSQDLGFPPPEGALFTVMTESLIESKHAGADDRHEFLTWVKPVAGLDPSMGNDECKLVFGLIGDIPGGLVGIQITENMVIYIDVEARDDKGDKVPVEYQIARRVRDECISRGVPAANLGVMAGGNPGVIGVMDLEWGETTKIQESGAPSDAPASVADPRPSDEVYDRRVSELYFLVRSLVEGGQIKGIYEAAKDQLCSRLLLVNKDSRKRRIEKKEDFKPRFGRSPDDAEAVIAMCTVARGLGLEPAGVDWNKRQDLDTEEEKEDTEAELHSDDTTENEAITPQELAHDEW